MGEGLSLSFMIPSDKGDGSLEKITYWGMTEEAYNKMLPRALPPEEDDGNGVWLDEENKCWRRGTKIIHQIDPKLFDEESDKKSL